MALAYISEAIWVFHISFLKCPPDLHFTLFSVAQSSPKAAGSQRLDLLTSATVGMKHLLNVPSVGLLHD